MWPTFFDNLFNPEVYMKEENFFRIQEKYAKQLRECEEKLTSLLLSALLLLKEPKKTEFINGILEQYSKRTGAYVAAIMSICDTFDAMLEEESK